MQKKALKLSVTMPNSRLPTNFQLSIFIFEARAGQAFKLYFSH